MSNLVNPLLVSMDRLILAALVPLSLVAFYTTPAEIVSRLWVVPNAVFLTVFPAFSKLSRTDPAGRAQLFIQSSAYVAAVTLPMSLLLALSGRHVLGLWLGADFAAQGGRVLQILAVAFFFNSLAFVPFALLQATGGADMVGKFMVAEIPLFATALVFVVPAFGLEGAAYTVLGRVTVESIGLLLLSTTVIPTHKSLVLRSVPVIAALALGLLVALRVSSTLSWLLAGGMLTVILVLLRRLTTALPLLGLEGDPVGQAAVRTVPPHRRVDGDPVGGQDGS